MFKVRFTSSVSKKALRIHNATVDIVGDPGIEGTDYILQKKRDTKKKTT